MYTILISLSSALLVGAGVYFTSYSYALAIILAVIIVIALNFLIGKHFLNKLTAIFQSVEKDLKSERADAAIAKLNDGYSIANWQLFVKEQINSQIGIIHYSRKRFEEAAPFLEKPFSKNWMAMCMKATLAFKEGNIDKVLTVMDKCIKGSPKEPFVYSLYAYFMLESDKKDKAVEVLQKGHSKIPLDDRLESHLSAVQNGKKIKMQGYGAMWLQLHIGKGPQGAGAKPYQALLQNQRIKRR